MNAYIARRNLESYLEYTKNPTGTINRGSLFRLISEQSSAGFANVLVKRTESKLTDEDIKEFIALGYKIDEFDIEHRKSHWQYSISW